MKYIFVLLSSVLFFQSSWVEIRDLRERFIIHFPEAPEYKQKEINTDLGKVENESYYVQGIKDHPNDLYVFNILSYSYPLVDPQNEDAAEEILQNTILDIAVTNKMKPAYSIIKKDDSGTPFADVRYLNQTKSKAMRAMIYLYPDKMVTMQVFMPEKQSLNDKIGYFFNSYKKLN